MTTQHAIAHLPRPRVKTIKRRAADTIHVDAMSVITRILRDTSMNKNDRIEMALQVAHNAMRQS